MATRKAAPKSLSLAPVLDLNEANALHSKLMGLREQISSSTLPRRSAFGALCVQALMAGAKSWEEDKHSFAFSKVSDAFTKTTQVIGVNIDHLMAKEI